ncbi:MAG: T9SS type A sorting domain-containing protein [Bacteroidota bacterium]
MKGLFILLSFQILFPASYAQSHFITAGQTQGMVVTDYVPDYSIPVTLYDQHFHVSGSVDVDLNRDSIYDFNISIRTYGGLAVTFTDCEIHGLNQNAIFTKSDTMRTCVSGQLVPTSFTQSVAKKYLAYDTLSHSQNASWQNEVLIEHSSSPNCELLTDYDYSPTDTPYYYFLRVITANDTLLGYLKFSTIEAKLLDFAIEGPTSSHIISSISNLASSNISISPNPFTSFIHITTEKSFQFTMSDYVGRVVLSGSADKTIRTEDLPAGNYLLTIKNEETVSVKKVVKVN